MKKIFNYIFALGVMGLSLLATSCGDNEDFSTPHVLTDAEIAELEYQQFIKDSLAKVINAGLIIEYDVPITIMSSSYDGTMVEIDTVKIADFFGITPTQLNEAIMNNRSDWYGSYDAPEVKGFCIEGVGHADNLTAYNTNSCWGHWWDENGNTTSWGDNARVFCEYDPETRMMHVGQMPGMLTDGQEISVIEGLRYQDLRVAIVFNVRAEAMGEVKAAIVNTQKLSIDMTPASEYGTTPLAFDLEKTLTDLGIASLDEAKFVAPKEDGSYAQEYTTTNGFWYNANGLECSWGENARAYTTYGEEHLNADEIGIGQFPGQTVEGDVYVLNYGILANNKIEMLEVTINIVGYQDPETKPEGEPTTIEKTITISKGYDNTYSAVNYDLKDLMKDAFKMTTYEIYKAINAGELKLYEGAVTEEAPSYTANAPGYWLDGEGHAAAYADGVFYVETGRNETTLTLNFGNHPDNCSPNGQSATTKLIYACNGGQLILNVTLEVTAFVDPETAPEGEPYDLEQTVTFSFVHGETQQWDGNPEVSAKVKDALKVTTHQFSTMLGTGEIKLYLNEITETPPTQCWEGSFFVDANGKPSDEANAACIVGLYPYPYADGGLTLEAATMPANNQAGQTINTTLIVVGKGVTVKIPVTVNIVAAQ